MIGDFEPGCRGHRASAYGTVRSSCTCSAADHRPPSAPGRTRATRSVCLTNCSSSSHSRAYSRTLHLTSERSTRRATEWTHLRAHYRWQRRVCCRSKLEKMVLLEGAKVLRRASHAWSVVSSRPAQACLISLVRLFASTANITHGARPGRQTENERVGRACERVAVLTDRGQCQCG